MLLDRDATAAPIAAVTPTAAGTTLESGIKTVGAGDCVEIVATFDEGVANPMQALFPAFNGLLQSCANAPVARVVAKNAPTITLIAIGLS